MILVLEIWIKYIFQLIEFFGRD